MINVRQPIFLIGMMGCGKTTIGKQLAHRLGWPFIDLDQRIEDECGLSIADFFETHGEDAFRELEREVLRKVIQLPGPSIVATGGGTPCFFDNMLQMKASGWVIYLKTPVWLLSERLEKETEKRPLLREGNWKQKLGDLLEKREAWYEQAHIIFKQDVEDLPVAEELIRVLL